MILKMMMMVERRESTNFEDEREKETKDVLSARLTNHSCGRNALLLKSEGWSGSPWQERLGQSASDLLHALSYIKIWYPMTLIKASLLPLGRFVASSPGFIMNSEILVIMVLSSFMCGTFCLRLRPSFRKHGSSGPLVKPRRWPKQG